MRPALNFFIDKPRKSGNISSTTLELEGKDMGRDATAFVFFGFVLDEDEIRDMCEKFNLKEFGTFTVEDEPGEVLAPYIKKTFGVPISFVVAGVCSYCFILGDTYASVYAPEYPKMFRTLLTEDLVLSADGIEQDLGLARGSIDWRVGVLYL